MNVTILFLGKAVIRKVVGQEMLPEVLAEEVKAPGEEMRNLR